MGREEGFSADYHTNPIGIFETVGEGCRDHGATLMFKSKCCHADVKWIISPDFLGDDPRKMRVGTCSFECEGCGQPCDTDIDSSFSKKKEPEKEFQWILTIEAVQNGYHLKGTDFNEVIEENEDDPFWCNEQLLWRVMSYFNFQGSKHDPERIWVVREKNK